MVCERDAFESNMLGISKGIAIFSLSSDCSEFGQVY